MSRWHLSRQHLSWQHLSISEISQLLLTKFFGSNYLGALIIGPKFFLDLNFVSTKLFWSKSVLDQTFFGNQCFWTQHFSDNLNKEFFWINKFSMGQNSFWTFFFIEQQCYSTKFLVILVNYKNNLNTATKTTHKWMAFDTKTTLSCISFYYSNVNQTDLWNHLRQLIYGTATFVQAAFVLVTITNLQTLLYFSWPMLKINSSYL